MSRNANINGVWNAHNNPYCDLIGPYQCHKRVLHADIPRPSHFMCEGLACETKYWTAGIGFDGAKPVGYSEP